LTLSNQKFLAISILFSKTTQSLLREVCLKVLYLRIKRNQIYLALNLEKCIRRTFYAAQKITYLLSDVLRH
jgi:hypothetical protein